MEEDVMIKKTLEMEVEGKLPKERPRKRWTNNAREDEEEKAMDLGRIEGRILEDVVKNCGRPQLGIRRKTKKMYVSLL